MIFLDRDLFYLLFVLTHQIHEDIALECSTAVIELLNRNVSPETGKFYGGSWF